MEVAGVLRASIVFFLLPAASAYAFWRYIWFFRNPKRSIPETPGVLSPADGTVVYVRSVPPAVPVISIKQNKSVLLKDIMKEDVVEEKLLIGIFMSPFDVHYNRSPLSGEVAFVRHYPPETRNHHMGSMHWRSILKKIPIYQNSIHIVANERTVTKISGSYKGRPVSCYIVQIAGGSVRGIQSFVAAGDTVSRGAVFGMIKIGSQVDLVISKTPGMTPRVRPGERVKAGETILIQ